MRERSPFGTSDGDAKSITLDQAAGRIVLAADKSSVSGWGTDDWPKWHPQYEGIIGLVFFASENAKLLPLGAPLPFDCRKRFFLVSFSSRRGGAQSSGA